jgi:hypothetical protein
MFDISPDRLGNKGNPGKSVHVRRFSQRADAVKYLDELIVRFKGNRGGMNRKNVGGYARPGL